MNYVRGQKEEENSNEKIKDMEQNSKEKKLQGGKDMGGEEE